MRAVVSMLLLLIPAGAPRAFENAPSVSRRTPLIFEFEKALRGRVLNDSPLAFVEKRKADPPEVLHAPFDEKAAVAARNAWAAYLKVPAASTNSLGAEFRLIPPGEYQMGASEAEIEQALIDGKNDIDREWLERETPVHLVKITKPFYLSVHEVTQSEFKRVMGRNPSRFSPDGESKGRVVGQDTNRFPVDSVTWYEALEFCNKLSKAEGRRPYYTILDVVADETDPNGIVSGNVKINGGNGYRLPTEAEWEYACRAGTTTPFHFGAGSLKSSMNVQSFLAPKERNFEGRTTAVGSYKKNAFDIADMHGNVSEWCWDWFDESYYRITTQSDPTGPAETKPPELPGSGCRATRGGDWVGRNYYARSASRSKLYPSISSIFQGFRVAHDH